MPKTIWIAVAVFAILGALMAAALAAGRISADTGIVAFGSVALVAVTIVYVGITSDIARANAETVAATRRLADETATLARETTKAAEAARQQANATQGTLLHLQRPVLVLRIYHQPDAQKIPMQVQNVGEGAAIWPSVYLVDEESRRNWLTPPPHIYPPQQFQEGDPTVLQRQRFELPKPTSDECFLIVRCQDPRTGELLDREWRVYTVGGGDWFANPVPGPGA